MVSEMIFNFNVDGNTVTGHAHMAAWPGDAEISNGKIHGDRITFTVLGKLPWTRSYQGVTTSGYPKLVFDGTLRGGEIMITLDWESILTTGEEETGRKLPMRAKRVGE